MIGVGDATKGGDDASSFLVQNLQSDLQTVNPIQSRLDRCKSRYWLEVRVGEEDNLGGV